MKGNNTSRLATLGRLKLWAVALLCVSAAMPTAAVNAASAAAPAAQDEPEVIRIYSSFPAGAQGTALVNAMNLALEQQVSTGLVCRGKFRLEHVLLNGPAADGGDERHCQRHGHSDCSDTDRAAHDTAEHDVKRHDESDANRCANGGE